MKIKILICFIFIFFTNSILGQELIEELIKVELEHLLEKGGILKNDKDRKELVNEAQQSNNRNKKKALLELSNDTILRRSILNEYPYPTDGKNEISIEKYSFPRVELSLFGSYLIEDTSKFSEKTFPPRIANPELPVLNSGSQVGITNPKRSNYRLFSNLTYLMSLTTDLKLDSDVVGYFNTKSTLAIKKSKTTNITLSVAFGSFSNALADIMSRAKRKDRFKPTEFAPLFTLWNLYASDEVDENYHIIEAFDGLSIYSTSRFNLMSGTDFKNATSIGVSSIPFVQVSAESDLSWKKGSTTDIAETSYQIYMIKKPDFQQIPSVEEMADLWKTFSSNHVKYDGDAQSLFISENNKLNTLQLKFGPLTDGWEKRVTIDKEKMIAAMNNNFIKDIKILSIEKSSEKGFYWLKLQFNRDTDFYRNISNEINSPWQYVDLNVRVLDPIGEYQLNRLYTLNVKTEIFPLPSLDGSSVTDLSDSNSMYKAKFKIDIQTRSNNVREVIIKNIKINDSELNQFELELNKREYKGKLLTNDMYEFEIESKINHSIFDQNKTLEAVIKLGINDNGENFIRHLTMTLPYTYPPELIKSNDAHTVLLESIEDIIDLLPYDTKLKRIDNKDTADGNHSVHIVGGKKVEMPQMVNTEDLSLGDYLLNAPRTIGYKSKIVDLLDESIKSNITRPGHQSTKYVVNVEILDPEKLAKYKN